MKLKISFIVREKGIEMYSRSLFIESLCHKRAVSIEWNDN